MLTLLPALLLLPVIIGSATGPNVTDAAALERFLLADSDAGVKTALEAALTLDGADNIITIANKFGPAYAAKIAGQFPDPGFRAGYTDVAKYLDLFGPCQKKQAGMAEGWWSGYPDPPSDRHCSEAAKLLFSALMWNQVHYCSRLATGEDKPKLPVASGKAPPYRLDEPPVATHWLHAEVLYSLADAALRLDFGKTLTAKAPGAPERVRAAMLAAAAELSQDKPNRELSALALAKLLLRRYEQVHLEHLNGVKAPPNEGSR